MARGRFGAGLCEWGLICSWLCLATIGFDLFAHGASLDSSAVQRAAVMIVSNLLLAALGAWLLYGRKLDPHQAPRDRSRQIAANLNVFLFLSMALSVLFAAKAADDLFGLAFLDAILVSAYFQAIALLSLGHVLRTLDCRDVDFDVYKAETVTT